MSKYPIPFGRHLLLERINVGGMAEVFKAKSFGVEGFERIVAVKRILPTLVEDEDFTTMFVDEARIASQLTHQNIVQIYDLGRHDETFYISMEYVAGRDLRAILDWQKKQGRPMEVAKACFIVSRVCEALEYAHRKRDPAGRDLKIIHRDVTPQNVILSYEGEVKLCDFGIAKAASRMSRTQVGVLKGKFAYMSPEQVRGQPIDRRADVFALGVIFYEMLTGERLFLGDTDYATLEAVRNAVIPPPRQYNPSISPALEEVMLRMLSKNPRDRYQWAAEVHEDLLEHIVAAGRPYHSRHLRTRMQEIYAREIEIENAKLESFMALRLPEASEDDTGAATPAPADVVMEMGEGGVARDPAESGGVELPGDPTDHFPVPSGRDPSELTYDDATDHAPPRVRAATNSPVSDLYGTPELGSSEEAHLVESGSDSAFVRPASASAGIVELPEERAESDGERTQFDMQVDPGLVGDANETLYDDANETVMGDESLEHEISAAQAELLVRLDAAGALDGDGATVDGATVDGATMDTDGIPELDPDDFDPAEYDPEEFDPDDPDDGATLHGDETVNGSLAFDEQGDDTNLNPLIASGDTEEDAFAATALRAEALAGAPFDEVMDDGTVEDAPLPKFDPEVFRRGVTPVDGASDQDTPADPSPAVSSASNGRTPAPVTEPRPPWRRAPSAVAQGRLTPRPIIERNHTQRPPEPTPPPPPPVNRGGGRFSNPRLVMMMAGGLGLLAAVLLVVVVTTMRPRSASLRITCEPRVVQVLLDGAFVGDEAPLELNDLPVGPHRIDLRAPGYVQYRQTIEIREPKPHQMSVVLEPSAEKDAPEGEGAPPPPSGDDDLPEGDGVPE